MVVVDDSGILHATHISSSDAAALMHSAQVAHRLDWMSFLRHILECIVTAFLYDAEAEGPIHPPRLMLAHACRLGAVACS